MTKTTVTIKQTVKLRHKQNASIESSAKGMDTDIHAKNANYFDGIAKGKVTGNRVDMHTYFMLYFLSKNKQKIYRFGKMGHAESLTALGVQWEQDH